MINLLTTTSSLDCERKRKMFFMFQTQHSTDFLLTSTGPTGPLNIWGILINMFPLKNIPNVFETNEEKMNKDKCCL